MGPAVLSGALLCGAWSGVPAHAQNVEDLPLNGETALAAEAAGAPTTGETVTIPRAVWEQLLRDVEALKAQRRPATTSGADSTTTTAPVTDVVGDTTGQPSVGEVENQPATGSRNYLLLPDISVISDIGGLVTTDGRDEEAENVDVEFEIGIQGYVYPRLKYDAFIVGNPGEEEFGVEEAYLTYQGLGKGLNVNVGRKFAPFGRTGELHPHSWLYPRQLIARQALVAGENLVGNGVNLNYTIPTGKKLFARASLGYFTAGEEAETRVNQFDPNDPFFGEFPSRPGSGLRKFYNARLWTGYALSERDELEFGASYAKGETSALALFDDGLGNEVEEEFAGQASVAGLDVSFRRFLGNNRRLLLRGEYFRYNPSSDLPTGKATGYYGLANLRLNRFSDVGVLYEQTEFPQAPGEEETALSLIYTRQFNERYYVRGMLTGGDRPGEGNYTEFRLQFVTGLGPHTHELE